MPVTPRKAFPWRAFAVMMAALEVPWFQQSSLGLRFVPVLQSAPPLTQSRMKSICDGWLNWTCVRPQAGVEKADPSGRQTEVEVRVGDDLGPPVHDVVLRFEFAGGKSPP